MSALQRVAHRTSLQALLPQLIPLARSRFFRTFLYTLARGLPVAIAVGLCLVVAEWTAHGTHRAVQTLCDWLSTRPSVWKLLEYIKKILTAAKNDWDCIIRRAGDLHADVAYLCSLSGLKKPEMYKSKLTRLETTLQGYYRRYNAIVEQQQPLEEKSKRFQKLAKSVKALERNCVKFCKDVTRTTHLIGLRLVAQQDPDSDEEDPDPLLGDSEGKSLALNQAPVTISLLKPLRRWGPTAFLEWLCRDLRLC